MQKFYLILIVLANANFDVFNCIMAGVMHLSILCPTTPLPGHIVRMEGYLTLKVALYMRNLCSNHYACTEVCYNPHVFGKAYNMTLEKHILVMLGINIHVVTFTSDVVDVAVSEIRNAFSNVLQPGQKFL